MKVTASKKILKSFAMAVVTLTALTMNYGFIADDISVFGYENPETIFRTLSKLLYSIEAPTVTALLFVFFLTIFYICLNDLEMLPRYTMMGIYIMAFFAAFCNMIGKLFYVYRDIGLLTRGTVQFLKGIFVFSGLFIFFKALIRFIVTVYLRYCNLITRKHFCEVFEKKYSGIVIATAILLAWIPTIAAYYPAIFMGDSEDIIYMAYNYPSGIEKTVLLLKEDFYVTNHHPVIYTGYVSLILHVVRMFGGSYNLGIFFCAVIQGVITLCVLTYSNMYCVRTFKSGSATFAAVLFYALFPLIPKYAIMISKDTFFADLLLLWAILIHKVVNTGAIKKDMTALAVTSAAIVLIRKNGIYVMILTLVVAAILYKNFWKRWLLVSAIVLAVNVLYSDIALPMVGIPEGSVREMLSVPFQQTARYVKYHEDEVTDEERYAIEGVLDYDSLAGNYSGSLSDPVKNTYHKDATYDELKAYFGAWFQMLLKHPEEYIAAFLHNYYGYFYPVVNDVMKLARTSVGSMANVNRDGYFDFSHCYNGFHTGLRDMLTFYDLLWMRIPVLNLLMTSALYVWVVILAFFLNCIRHDKAAVLTVFTYLALLLTVLVGPSNAINYERYVFPCILGMPFLVTITLSKNERSIKNV